MNPTALLKIIAALVPLMGDKEIGQSMVAEIQAMFDAMQVSARALVQIQHRLTSIDQKLMMMGAQPTEGDIDDLMMGNYPRLVSQAIELGETHNANE